MKRHLLRLYLLSAWALTACGPLGEQDASSLGASDDETGSTADPVIAGRLETGYPAVGYFTGSTGHAMCGATLIRQDVAVTAQHCLFTWDRSWPLRFALGTSGVGPYYPVTRVVFHPRYHDVAVLMLGGPTLPTVPPAQVVDPTLGEGYRAIGYGRTTYGARDIEDGYTHERKSIAVRIDEILSVEASGTGPKIFMSGLDGELCYGDSGGPLMEEGTNNLLGVLTRGQNVSCSPNNRYEIAGVGSGIGSFLNDAIIGLSQSFTDVKPGAFGFREIQTLHYNGITQGCYVAPNWGLGRYCPASNILRSEMAVFLVRAKYKKDGKVFNPGAVPFQGTFADVPSSHFAAYHIEELDRLGITAGCGTEPGTNRRLFCPESPVTRAEMAVFLGRSAYAGSELPAPAGVFSDLPSTHFAARAAEHLYRQGVSRGCSASPLAYCPNSLLSRAEMAIFVARAFELELGTVH